MPFIEFEGEIPANLAGYTNYQCYNVLDSMVTAQLFPVMMAKLNDNTRRVYKREMRLRSLCLEMSSKGFPIDRMCLAELDYALSKDMDKALSALHKFCSAVDAKAINPRSTTDVPWLFYEHLGIPPILKYDRKTKERKVSSDIEALEKIRESYPTAIPFVNAILAYREAAKMRSVFARGLEPDTGNLRCSFSPSGTETGRLSSQQNPYNRGTNGQNLTNRVRQVITAPEGYCILNYDLKTAESLAVGFISGCTSYIEACKTGDVHTAASRLNWPNLSWTGDIKADRKIAESPYYRMFSYRDIMKKGGHGTNYYGTPRTLSAITKVAISVFEDFQLAYFREFPEIQQWHLETIARLQMDGVIVNQLGRERRFWGRPDDPATHREAIAFDPQSLVADVMNEGLMQAQAWLLKECKDAKGYIGRGQQLLPLQADLRAQVHDAGVFLVPIEAVESVAVPLLQHLIYPVDFGPKGVMEIQFDMQIGKRWCKAKGSGTMSTGLKDWTPGQALHFS